MSVESRRFPYLPLSIHIRGRRITVEALIDTGFDGDVVVPRDLLADDLLPDSDTRWWLPDGSAISAPSYDGVAQIGQLDGVDVTVVSLGDEALVGRGVIDRYRLILDHGVRVIVET